MFSVVVVAVVVEQYFLPQNFSHDAKKKKMVNCGVVAFTLERSAVYPPRSPPTQKNDKKEKRVSRVCGVCILLARALVYTRRHSAYINIVGKIREKEVKDNKIK